MANREPEFRAERRVIAGMEMRTVGGAGHQPRPYVVSLGALCRPSAPFTEFLGSRVHNRPLVWLIICQEMISCILSVMLYHRYRAWAKDPATNQDVDGDRRCMLTDDIVNSTPAAWGWRSRSTARSLLG